MALTKMTADLDIIQALADKPNVSDGLSAQQLKQKFDESGNTIKGFINNTLTEEIDTALVTDPTLSIEGKAADAEATGELGEMAERAVVTPTINGTDNGVSRLAENGKLKLWGTATNSRRVLFLNGQDNGMTITTTAFSQTLPAGKYDIVLTRIGTNADVQIYYTYTTFAQGAPLVSSSTPTKNITFTAPVMIGLFSMAGTNYGTEANPTIIELSIKERTAKDITARATLDKQGYVSPWYEGENLTIKFASEISNYTDPWAWIKARIDAGNFDGLHIADYIPFKTAETTPHSYNAQIAGINTYKGYGSPAIGNHIDFVCKELWYSGTHAFNPVNINNGTKFGDNAAVENPWLASDMYLWLNSLAGTVASSAEVGGGEGTAKDYTSGGVYYYLPAALKAVISDKYCVIPKRYSSSGLLTDDNANSYENMGKLWIPTEYEMFGDIVIGSGNRYAKCYAVQYPLFAFGNARIKSRGDGGSVANYSYLVASSSNSTSFGLITTTGAISERTASSAQRVPFGFRIA